MYIYLIQVGKTHETYTPLETEFKKRLQHFAKIHTTTLAVSDKEKESREIAQKIESGTHVAILDERGREFTSPEFARFIERQRDLGPGKITFIIGGPEGMTKELRNQADTLIALSKMTIAHQLARLLFWEQLYRASTIIAGHPYHK